MKEAITKFDLEAAFKALDDIDIPAAGKVRANRPALTEIFSRKSKFDSLMEEYYDVSNNAELEDAQEAREAEVAKAKLARIEKIVDLEADSPEDLLTSYVGKYIMQCPQCMTLFYKNQEDIVEDENDPNTVNVNEVCQHCGNETGYTLIGKVGEAEDGEFSEEAPELDVTADEPVEEEQTDEGTDETGDTEELDDLDSLDLDLDLDDVSEEKTEEAFTAHTGETLVEELTDDAELDDKLEAHNEYIEYLRAAIAQEEEKLEKATNEQVKVALQRNIDAFKADLENALPDAVKNGTAVADMQTEENTDDNTTEEVVDTEPATQEEAYATIVTGEALTEALHEDNNLEISEDEFEELIKSPEFKKPISDAEARAMINDEKDEAEESAVNEAVSEESANNEASEELTEGGLLTLGKAIGKKIAQGGKNLKDKVSAAIDKFADSAKTREEKADWVLANALEDYSNVEFSNDGNVDTNGAKKRFNNFIVIGYTNKDTDGKDIATEPANADKLVMGMQVPQEKTSYKDADSIAKGWSQRQGNGPAYIYLAKNKDDDKAVYLCSYFNGKLSSKDQLNDLFNAVASDIAGNAAMEQGGMDQSTTSKVKADAIKPGMKVRFTNGTEVEITSIKKVTNQLGDEVYRFNANTADGKKVKPFDLAATYEFNVLKSSINATESFNSVMNNLEELDEATVESLISSSLVESYGNVAGFRLTECAFTDGNFTIDGTIYFTSGNTRKTTYAFSKAAVDNNTVCLRGLNEKLGLEKQFELTGKIDNKTLITESFRRSK